MPCCSSLYSLHQREEQAFPCGFLQLGHHFSAVKSPSPDSMLSHGRKRTCHFKFSAGHWHFIIYVFHVIMLDNITNDAIRSTGNLKWCTPVLTWERSSSSYTTSPAESQQHTKPLHRTLLPDWQTDQVGGHEVNSFNLLGWASDLAFLENGLSSYWKKNLVTKLVS